MGQSKEPIRLRQRRTPSGLISLYLDIYLNGRRSYEYLKVYLVPEKTRADKEKQGNFETCRCHTCETCSRTSQRAVRLPIAV